ncbi:phage portal protein [Escherichia coli]
MGKGSSKGHTPREAKDNLKSTQLLSVIDAISEGPIEGPVDGLKSVLLNSTPVLDTEGNTNISGVTVVFRAGEQEQTPPEGFESSGSETVLGTEVKYDTPITRTITSANIDRLRFTFGVQALVETTSKGDRNPSEVRLLVQIQRNGGWVTEKDITIKGKTTSQYLASVVVDNLPPRPFNIRMRRMTPDSTTDQLQNKTLWSSYTEIIDVKQCYPNTALVGVQVDSEQFGSQQVSRNYHLRGRILQVPSNYNPQTRQYSGIWDGTLKPAYSNNMAWCLWDMLTHPRYGMGKRLGAADVDKWALYVIGQNCDQSVPDGFGGTEPRITCNAYLTTQRKAWDVLSDFCSAMRCMPVWNGQTLTFVQDRQSDKVWTYNRSNVVMPDDGAPFRYSFSALKDRHNAVEVNWIDPNNGWETATELVEDTQAIARYGRNVTKMDAFGCTSRGQAHRAGLWLIKTELLETQTVDFSVGAEGLRHVPGDVIEICDDDYAGISIGGRVLAVNSQTRTLTLDREITLPSSGTTLISLVDGEGNPVSVEVQSVTDGVKVKVSRVPDGVAEYSVWGLKLPTLRQRLFRCVSIRENDDGTYAITAVQHVPEKEAIVDNGAHFDGDQSGTVNGVTPPAVQHLTAEVTADSGEYQVLARWDTPKVVKGVSFLLRLTVAADDGSERLVSTARTTETTYRFTQLALGRYERELTIQPGIIYDDLKPGEEIGMVKSDRPNPNLETFRNGQLRAVAAGSRLSFSSTARNYNGTYSAQRQELVESTDGYLILQDWFIGAVTRPMYRAWLKQAVASGVIRLPRDLDRSSLYTAVYSGPVMPWIDPVKEAEAWKIQIRGGAATESDWVRAGGRNPDDVKRRRKAEIDENRKLDLVFDTDPASDKGGSSAATKRQEPQHTDDQSEE